MLLTRRPPLPSPGVFSPCCRGHLSVFVVLFHLLLSLLLQDFVLSTTSSFEAADQFDGLASKLQFSFSACGLNVCNDLAKAMKALDGKKSASLIVATKSQMITDDALQV